MEFRPLVSIIINNYNYDRFLSQAIDSVLNQTYSHIEVIVVDDGSTDTSRDIIAKYGDRVIPILKENGGQPSNYNIGFAMSKGEIICFLDSDDTFTLNKIERIVQAFKSSEIGWCFHSLELVDENGRTLPITTTRNYVTRQCDFRALLEAGKIPPNLPSSSALCFRKALLGKILPMPTPKLLPCTDHYVKYMAVALSEGFILDEALTLQRIHGNNAATLRDSKRHLKAREYIFTSYWIKQRFPTFNKFANKLISVGIAIHWNAGNNDCENKKAIKSYLDSTSLLEQLEIDSRAIYYCLKERLFSWERIAVKEL